MAGEPLLSGLKFVLHRDDSDKLVKREDGIDGKVYGGRFHEGAFRDKNGDPINWVARLKVTLAKRGFRLDPSWDTLDHKNLRTKEKDGEYTPATEWAVREFQIAAKYLKALREDGEQIKMPAEARYTGPISGVLNSETLSALNYWDDQTQPLTQPLMCQIRLSGFEKVVTDETTGNASHPNLWRDDEVKKSIRVFALDQSESFYRSGLPAAPRDPKKYQVTGGLEYYSNTGTYGPITDAKYSWKRESDESEVLPERLFDLASGSVLDRQLATYRIIRAAADVECFGFFEGGNAYDSQIVSFGLVHWTIRSDNGGEFPAFLAYFQQRYPKEFEQAISRFGLFTSRVWPRVGGSADGLSLLLSGKMTYDCQSSLATEANEADVMPGALDEMRYLRNWHWLYRFIMAGRGEDAYRRAMWDMARIRLRIILDANWPDGNDWPKVNTRAAKLGETFRSEQVLAMLIRWNILGPAFVRNGNQVGSALRAAYATVRGEPPFSNDHNVANWKSRHESRLADQIIKQFDAIYNKNKEVTDDGFNITLRQAGQWLDASTEHDRSYLVSSKLPRARQTFSIAAGSPADQCLTFPAAPQAGGVTWSFVLAGNPDTGSIFLAFQDAGLPLTGDGARVARINSTAPESWYVEDRQAPQNGNDGTLIRRFELARLDENSESRIRVRELLNEFTIFAGESAATQLPLTSPKQGVVQWLRLLSPLNASVLLFQRFADENITLTANGARVGRATPWKDGPRHWYLEDREAPVDNNEDGALLRRFHLLRLPSQDIRVRELPVVSQRRDERDQAADQMFTMDLAGLPRFKVKNDPDGAMVAFSNTAELNQLLDDGGDLDGDLWDLVHNSIKAHIPASLLSLPKPATVRLVETVETSAFVVSKTRWHIATDNPNLEYLTFRRDPDFPIITVDWPGRSERYAGQVLQSNDPHVATLRRDLRQMGFRIIPPLTNSAADEQYDSTVKASVRAFQAYARGDRVAQEKSPANSPHWVLNLEFVDVPYPMRFHGPVNGIVTPETRALIDHWIAEKWRCPVVIDARASSGGEDTTIVPGKDNLWRFDEHTDPAHFFFVTDFSHPFALTRPLGVYQNGPAVKNVDGFAPAIQEISVATMTPGSLPKTSQMTSTVKILRAVAGQLPCQGFLDGVTATDEQRVANIGAMNLHENPPTATDATKLKGRMGALMCLSRELEPRAFGQSFGRDRIESLRAWKDVAKSILEDDDHGRLLTEVVRQNQKTDGTQYKDPLTGADRPEWRGWHSVYRLVSAARQPGIGQAYYDIARLELATLGALSINATYRLKQIVTSERAWAMLAFWHAKYPMDLCKKSANKRVPAQPLNEVIAAVDNISPHDLPFDTSEAQKEFVNQIKEKVRLLYSNQTHQKPDPDQDFVDRINDLGQDESGLSIEKDSFLFVPTNVQHEYHFDADHLPHFKFKTGLLTALLNPSKKPMHTAGLGLVASSETTTTSLGFYGSADIENNKFYATHSAFTIADSNGNLHTLICPLLTEREMDLELNEPENFTTTVYRSPGQKEESLAVIRCKATDSNKEQLKGDADKWGFNPAAVLGTPAIPVTAGFQFADLDFDVDGFLTGTITADFGFQPPFGDPLPLSLGGVGNLSADVAFSEFTLDEDSGLISAPTTGLFKTLASFLNLPDGSEFDFTGAIDGDRFALSFATPKLSKMALDLVPTLVSFDMENVRLNLDTRTGFGINLADGIDRAKVGLASDLFANAGSDAVINHACESIADAGEDFGKLFKLGPDDANGILMEAGSRLVSWDGRFPRLASSLLGGLTKLEVNAARRLRSFAGELLGGLAERCHSKFNKAVGRDGNDLPIRHGRDSEQGVWFVEVPLQMKFNDEANHAGASNDAAKRDFLKLTGWFRFTCPCDDDFARFGAGSFCVDPEVVLEVDDLGSYKGRAFGNLVSLHIPDKSVFVFNTDPTQASIRWDVERSRAKQAETANADDPAAAFQKILIRVPASTGDIDPKKMSEPEAKRFTFEMSDFGLGVAGLDLAGQIRVESVSMNDDDSDVDQQTETGLKAPLSIEKADSRPKDASDDIPVVGEIRFRKSRLVFGSLKAGFQLRYFDNATGTIAFAMAEDLETKKLSVTGTVEINSPIEYKMDALYALFQLKTVRLSTTYTRKDGKVSWTSDGAIAGSIKFQPPAGKSADGPLAALSDFFAGVTCEFEDLNPVKLGRGASVTFNFPPKTFNLANVMEVDLNGITVGDNSKLENKNRFGLLGDVRLKDLPGVGGTLTFGGIDLTSTDSGLPEININRIGAALTLPGGIGIEAEFERIKNEQESGFAGRMTLTSESLPKITGLLKLTEVRCLTENRSVPSLALYLASAIDAPLIFGFYLRGLGMGLGIFQGLRGLRKADSRNKSITQRVISFVDDPRGLPDPGTIEAWQPDAPETVRSRLNWMLVAQALITYGKFPPDKPHVITGTLLGALDQDLTLTLGTNIWLFASPEEVTKPDFKPRPVARGAMQISPREGKVFAYFRTLPNPKMGPTAPELVTKVLDVVQTSCMFLADGNGFLTEVGWPWETRVDAAKIGLPSPLKGELSAGFRFGIYRGVVTFGLNFGIDVQMKADVGFDFSTPLGSAGAHLSINGSGMFRASFIGAIDQAQRPYLLGDVRVAAQVAVQIEAHCELSKKITKWCRIRLRIRFRESFNLSVTAALAAAFDSGGLGFSGDAHVAISVKKYRISGQVVFQYNPERVGSVRNRLDEILPKPITAKGGQGIAPNFSPVAGPANAAMAAAPAGASEGLSLVDTDALGDAVALAEAAEVSTLWNYRSRQVVVSGTTTRRVMIALVPAPGTRYPELRTPNDPPTDRFSIALKVNPDWFKGFLLGGDRGTITDGVLNWSEDCAAELISTDEMRREYERLDEGVPEAPAPEPLTVGTFLFGVGNSDMEEPSFDQTSELVDPRTRNPSAEDADDETVGVAPKDYRSPNFGRNTEYDRRVANSCSRQGEVQDGNSPRSVSAADDPEAERIDGPSAAMLAIEVLDLFSSDALAVRPQPTVRENVPADMFVAQFLRSVMVFDLPDDGRTYSVEDLIDVQSFKIRLAKAQEGHDGDPADDFDPILVTLKDAIPKNSGEYDLIVGHHFQSRELIGLCWDLRLEDQPNDAFAAYKSGFEHFRVTRTNLTKPTVKPRIKFVTPCWLDPTKGGRDGNGNVNQTELIRPQFQYVDHDLGNPDDANSDFREGDELLYRVEAIGPSVFDPQTRQSQPTVLTQCLFGITRQSVRPQAPPVIAQALHLPVKGTDPEDPARLIDAGLIELSLVSPGVRSERPNSEVSPDEILKDEICVRYRLVPSSSVGSYGFDSPVSATTKPESGLSNAASEGLGVQTIRFNASPRSRPMPWEETTPLDLIKADDWESFQMPLPPDPNRRDESHYQPVLRLKNPLSLSAVRERIAEDYGDDALRGQAVEFWIGREKIESQRSISHGNNGSGTDDARNPSLNTRPIQRSILVQCRHAVLLPEAKSAAADMIDRPEITKDYFTIGTPVSGIEYMASRHVNPTPESRYLSPTLLHCELRGSSVPLGYDPNTPQLMPHPNNIGAPIPNPRYRDIQSDVRLRLTWRMPPEPIDENFDPVIAFRQYRVDRFNPVLHRIHNESVNGVETKLIEPRLERVVQVVPDQLYRSTPDLIDVLAISDGGNRTTPTFRGDWQARPEFRSGMFEAVESILPRNTHPFSDDPDRAGSTFLHDNLLSVADTIAKAMTKILGTPVRAVWRVREPFEDRADLMAGADRAQDILDPDKPGPFPAAGPKETRFKTAFDQFAASHEAKDDPYGWKTLESLGLAAELLFVIRQTNEPVNLDQLCHRDQLIEKLKDAWEPPDAPPKPPVAIVFFQADDGFTLLNVVRLMFVGKMPKWLISSDQATETESFDLRLAAGLKFLGVDPALRSLRHENGQSVVDAWKRDFQFNAAGPVVAAWLTKNLVPRVERGLRKVVDISLAGHIHFFRQTLFEPRQGFETAITRALPIQEDGTVRIDLPVPDRLAHIYDIALEPCRRYDALWEQLLIERDPDGSMPVAEEQQMIPLSQIFPVKIDRTRPLVRHNIIATPLQGAVQSYVFAHPAEFAACASAINAAAVEYSGHTVYLQRRIPTMQLDRIKTILTDRTSLPVDWDKYKKWLLYHKYEQIEFVEEPSGDEEPNADDRPDRRILLTPPTDNPELPPKSWNAMRMLSVTQVGIYGADRYVIPDVPAYYEYRFAAFSTAGKAQSPLAVTPFVKPLFDEIIQPPSSEGRMIASHFIVDDQSPLNGETILALEIVLAHPRLHLRPEMRGLWVSSDEKFDFPQQGPINLTHFFGSLPDLDLEYVLLFNGNYVKGEPDGFQILNPLITLIPPLDPQRQPDDHQRYSPLFLAKSPDDTCARILDADRIPQREATVPYIQNPDDGSIRLKLELQIGHFHDQNANGELETIDTPKARTLRALIVHAGKLDSPNSIRPELFTFVVRRSGVQSQLIRAQDPILQEDHP